MADLWDRLRAAEARAAAAPAPESSPPPPAEAAPEGWVWTGPLVAERRLRFSLDPKFWSVVGPLVDERAWQGTVCFDTETTGLSGGAGTVAFLVGWAELLPGDEGVPDVEVRQWFLRDHPGEPDLLDALEGALAPVRQLVSFNGASFDLPLLKSRWALAGRTFPALAHRDDLHPARRLWKRVLENCRLGTVEQTVLGLRRVDDVPGALVPELWFAYLRDGAAADFLTPLEGVLRHHAQDVYSLLCLDLLLAAMTSSPQQERWEATFAAFPARRFPARPAEGGLLHPDLGPSTPADFWGLTALRVPEDADRALAEAWADEGTEAVGLAWADRLKRRGNPAAAEVWGRLWADHRSYPALEELLKWLEHREKTPEARARGRALAAEGLQAPFVPRTWRENLEKRLRRLEKGLPPSG